MITEQLCWCARNGDVEGIRHLLENRRANPNFPSSTHHFKTPLHMAAEAGAAAAVHLLLKNGSVVDPIDKFGFTPLMLACLQESSQRQLGFSLGSERLTDTTLSEGDLSEQVLKSYATVIELLLDANANPAAADHTGNTLLHVAASLGTLPEVLPLLKERSQPRNYYLEEDPFETAVEVKAERGKLEALLGNPGWGFLTPLHYACDSGRLTVVKFLLQGRSKSSSGSVFYLDIDARDACGWTPLHWAAKSGHADVCLFLLSCGANPSITDFRNLRPSNLASLFRHFFLSRLLVEAETRSKVQSGKELSDKAQLLTARLVEEELQQPLFPSGHSVTETTADTSAPSLASPCTNLNALRSSSPLGGTLEGTSGEAASSSISSYTVPIDLSTPRASNRAEERLSDDSITVQTSVETIEHPRFRCWSTEDSAIVLRRSLSYSLMAICYFGVLLLSAGICVDLYFRFRLIPLAWNSPFRLLSVCIVAVFLLAFWLSLYLYVAAPKQSASRRLRKHRVHWASSLGSESEPQSNERGASQSRSSMSKVCDIATIFLGNIITPLALLYPQRGPRITQSITLPSVYRLLSCSFIQRTSTNRTMPERTGRLDGAASSNSKVEDIGEGVRSAVLSNPKLVNKNAWKFEGSNAALAVDIALHKNQPLAGIPELGSSLPTDDEDIPTLCEKREEDHACLPNCQCPPPSVTIAMMVNSGAGEERESLKHSRGKRGRRDLVSSHEEAAPSVLAFSYSMTQAESCRQGSRADCKDTTTDETKFPPPPGLLLPGLNETATSIFGGGVGTLKRPGTRQWLRSVKVKLGMVLQQRNDALIDQGFSCADLEKIEPLLFDWFLSCVRWRLFELLSEHWLLLLPCDASMNKVSAHFQLEGLHSQPCPWPASKRSKRKEVFSTARQDSSWISYSTSFMSSLVDPSNSSFFESDHERTPRQVELPSFSQVEHVIAKGRDPQQCVCNWLVRNVFDSLFSRVSEVPDVPSEEEQGQQIYGLLPLQADFMLEKKGARKSKLAHESSTTDDNTAQTQTTSSVGLSTPQPDVPSSNFPFSTEVRSEHSAREDLVPTLLSSTLSDHKGPLIEDEQETFCDLQVISSLFDDGLKLIMQHSPRHQACEPGSYSLDDASPCSVDFFTQCPRGQLDELCRLAIWRMKNVENFERLVQTTHESTITEVNNYDTFLSGRFGSFVRLISILNSSDKGPVARRWAALLAAGGSPPLFLLVHRRGAANLMAQQYTHFAVTSRDSTTRTAIVAQWRREFHRLAAFMDKTFSVLNPAWPLFYTASSMSARVVTSLNGTEQGALADPDGQLFPISEPRPVMDVAQERIPCGLQLQSSSDKQSLALTPVKRQVIEPTQQGEPIPLEQSVVGILNKQRILSKEQSGFGRKERWLYLVAAILLINMVVLDLPYVLFGWALFGKTIIHTTCPIQFTFVFDFNKIVDAKQLLSCSIQYVMLRDLVTFLACVFVVAVALSFFRPKLS